MRPRSIAVPQSLRFAIAGSVTAGTYFAVTVVLNGLLGVPLQPAIAVGYVVSICVHFSLQRFFVFRSQARFTLAIHHQVARYLGISLTQYGFTASVSAFLPGLLGVSPLVVYMVTALLAASVVFLLLRSKVFRHDDAGEPQ